MESREHRWDNRKGMSKGDSGLKRLEFWRVGRGRN